MLERVRPTLGGNVSDATRLQALEACTATYTLLQEALDAAKVAKSEHAAELKRWRGQGINLDALKQALRDRFSDEGETIAQLHEYIRFRALQNIPNIQQDLAALWAPIDLPEERRAELERQRWRDDGALAARQGFTRDTNPHELASEAYQAWDGGWLDDQERIASAMARGEAPVVVSLKEAKGKKK